MLGTGPVSRRVSRPRSAGLKAENRRLREDNEILEAASIFFAGELDPRNRCSSLSSMSNGLRGTRSRRRGRYDQSIVRVLRQQGVRVAARTYRAWSGADQPVALRTLTDAVVMDAARDIAWTRNARGERVLAPEGLSGRRKMAAHVRRATVANASAGAVDRAMRALGAERCATGSRRSLPPFLPPTASVPDDLLDRDFTAAPNRVWVTDFTYVRTWAEFVYVAFIIDVFAHRIVAWHASMSKTTDLVMAPLRMAIRQRDREGHPVGSEPGAKLIHHSDAGSQYTSIRFTEHLDIEGIRPSIGSVGGHLRQRPDRDYQRAPRDRVHPHHGLPPPPLPDPR